ncbi:MAG: hypothetical protein AAGG44_17680, partial [Planctomycetota bacterium]
AGGDGSMRRVVLTAAVHDTNAVVAQQNTFNKSVLDLLASLDPFEIAKKNGSVRDAYRAEDRSLVEQAVKQAWSQQGSDQGELNRIVIPKSSWSMTYGARFDHSSNRVLTYETERLTTYVVTQVSDEIVRLNPIRLEREHYHVNGKRLGKSAPEPPVQIPTNEFPFLVLEKNIR